MKHERVEGSNVDLKLLMDSIEAHLKVQGLQTSRLETRRDYQTIRATKHGVLRTVIGAVRDVEIDMVGSSEKFELTLRTGAWGRDIAIPALEGFIMLGGIGAVGGAGLGALMAHEFEQKFWKWLEAEVRTLSGGTGSIGARYTPPMIPAQLATEVSSTADRHLERSA